jgi:hypothetical protein
MRPESLSILPVTGSDQLIVVTPFALSTRDALAPADPTGALTAAASARRIGAGAAAFPAAAFPAAAFPAAAFPAWRGTDCSATPVTTD